MRYISIPASIVHKQTKMFTSSFCENKALSIHFKFFAKALSENEKKIYIPSK